MQNSPQSNAGHSAAPALPWLTAALLFWPVALAGAALDLWSKSAVFRWLEELPEQQFVLIDGFLQFILRENDGAAFSLFGGKTFFLVGISIVALVVVIYIFFFEKNSFPADAVCVGLYDQRHHRQPV